jgi:outer membrane protein insertion porin family
VTGFSTDADDDWLRTFQDVLIRRAWLNEGFQKAEVKATQRPLLRDAAGQHVEVTITVDEGMQYRLGEVTFRTSDPTRPLIFSEEKLRKTIPLNEGDLFDTSKVRESIEALKVLYGSHGYIDFVTTPITDIDNETQRINLTMELDQQ